MTTQTKQIIAEIGKDTRRELTRAGMATLRGLEQVACKASYPILGNLSANLQYGIQNALGEKYYNAADATGVSSVLNGVAYGFMGAYGAGVYEASKLTPDPSTILIGGVFGAMLGIAEAGSKMKEVRASLLGKIVSLPIEGILNTYSAGKKYLQDVKERVRLDEEIEKETVDAQKANSFPTDYEEFDRQFANDIGEGIRKIPITKELTTALEKGQRNLLGDEK